MTTHQHNAYLDMSLLRFTTAGSVDDGKSTLIGRLLYDSKSIFEDQLSAITETSKRHGDEINLALLTDGLRAEREQGITIDVAYRYFATPKRKFIIADTPGHIQYTRNMVTGASTANLAMILVDARLGVLEQTLRHTYIANLLNIPHIVFCINKMDLVGYKETIFREISAELQALAKKLSLKDTRFIPVSAKFGDNVVDTGSNMPWYNGTSLLNLLETIKITKDNNMTDPRFPVQYIIRPQKDRYHDYRGYAGRMAAGTFKPGDRVTVLPSELTTTIKTIDFHHDQLDAVYPGQSATITLADDIDISRGDMIVGNNNLPQISNTFSMDICWFNDKPLKVGKRYLLKHTTNEARCVIQAVNHKTDINSCQDIKEFHDIRMNDIANITVITAKPLFFDPYRKCHITGSVILIEEGTNETVAAGMIN